MTADLTAPAAVGSLGSRAACAPLTSRAPPTHPPTPSRPLVQIKSTTLDAWQMPWIELVARVGNVRFNAVWEARLTDR